MKKRVAKTISTIELLDIFSTETKAVKWFEQIFWGEKPICPKCGGTKIKPYAPREHNYYCNPCRRAFTVRVGTVLQDTKMSLRKWAIAFYLVLTARKGISSLQLSKELGITQKSAWFMLQRIREACKQGRFKLDGDVEIDETYLGGKEKNKHGKKKLKAGRGTAGKQAVFGMRERDGKVKAMPVEFTDRSTLQGKINQNVKAGATVFTDEHRSYIGLEDGYDHQSVNHSAKEFVNGMAHTNGIESVWAVLKRGYNGIYHNWSMKHCHRYVDEFTFRLNDGNCQIDTIDRMVSLAKGMSGKRLTYAELIQ